MRAAAPVLANAGHLVAGEDLAPELLRLAAELARPARLRVCAAQHDAAWRRLGDGQVSEPLAGQEALIIDPSYRAATRLSIQAAGPATLHQHLLCLPWVRSRPVRTEAPAPDIVIDVGFGVGDAAAYARWVRPLAAALEATYVVRVAIGGTRKAVQDLGLVPPSGQIGQTGMRVAPELLFSLGVSGAPQHLDGIDPGSVIIAINRDPEAPIFHLPKSRYPRLIACVGALETWLPALLQSMEGGARTAETPQGLSDTMAGRSTTGAGE